MSDQELKPCPFCGGEALNATTAESSMPYIECIKCHATMLSPDAHGAHALAAKWNTRETDWRPIDTVPLGVSVLTLTRSGVIEGDYDGDMCQGYYGRDMMWYATHWMPLPEPPKP